jgi:predicted HAD superfamily Cof-like phosphohydrolase
MTINKVKEFHIAFGIKNGIIPGVPDKRTCLLRLHLLQEELGELAEAMAADDIVASLDALTDLQYVLDGTYLAMGLHGHKERAFDEVHNSNMSKLGADGKPILNDAGRVVKGENYVKPDLEKVLNIANY